jgi:hypothetical protein
MIIATHAEDVTTRVTAALGQGERSMAAARR